MIIFQKDLQTITAEDLDGFFVGWANSPSKETLLVILENSQHIHLALDQDTKKVIGFINAISDKVLTAYIPLLEVLPEYQGQGIGTALVTRMIETLEVYYMVDLLCDKDLLPFYKRFQMHNANAVMIRNYKNQNGKRM